MEDKTINEIRNLCEKLVVKEYNLYDFFNDNKIVFEHLFDGSKIIKFLTKKQLGHYQFTIEINQDNEYIDYQFYNSIHIINSCLPEEKKVSHLTDFKLLLEEILISSC